jgi:hypothetical protein
VGERGWGKQGRGRGCGPGRGRRRGRRPGRGRELGVNNLLLLLEDSVKVVKNFVNIFFQIPHSILHIIGLFIKLFEIVFFF